MTIEENKAPFKPTTANYFSYTNLFFLRSRKRIIRDKFSPRGKLRACEATYSCKVAAAPWRSSGPGTDKARTIRA